MPRAGSGREYVVTRWSLREGLPQHTVQTITETRDGYLWFGTYDGLCRFDGLHFTTFNSANTPAIPSANITALFEDHEGTLWIGTELGATRHRSGKFFAVPEQSVPGQVTSFAETPDGRLFVGTERGVFVEEGDGFKEMLIPDAALPTRHTNVAVDPQGRLWVAHRAGLYLLTESNLRRNSMLESEIRWFSFDPDGTTWCALQNDKLMHVNGTTVRECGHAPGIKKKTRFRSRRNDVWLPIETGALRVRDEKVLDMAVNHGFPNFKVVALFEDSNDNLWLGTSGGGLIRLHENPVESFSASDGLKSLDTAAVMEDRNGRIWLGTFSGGLHFLDNGTWKPSSLAGLPLTARSVISLCESKDGALWIGTLGGGAFRWQDGQMQHTIRQRDLWTRTLFEDRDGGIWFGSDAAGVEHHLNGQIRRYDVPDGLSSAMVTGVAQDKSGDIWVGTGSGLNRIASGKISRFFRKDGLRDNLINALYVDSDGVLWIGTGGGLSRFKDGHLSSVSKVQGLAHDSVTQITGDDDGNLWMGTRMGLLRAARSELNAVLDGRSPRFRCVSFTDTDGLPGLGFVPGYQPSCIKARDGRLWFCSSAGPVVIDPKRMNREVPDGPVVIETVLADDDILFGAMAESSADSSSSEGSALLPESRFSAAGKPLRAKAGTFRLQFQYTAVNLSTPDRVQFRCKLEGYDDDWRDMGAQRTAHYTRVPPGEYRFRVETTRGGSPANVKGAALALIVMPRYYQTWWFRAGVITTVGGLLLGPFRVRRTQARQIEQMRLRIARDLHDEVGSNLGNIALLSRIARENETRAGSTASDLAEISEIAVETVDVLQDVVWFTNPEFDTLEKLLRRLDALAHRTLKNIPFTFEGPEFGYSGRLSLQLRRNVLLIFKEALHNIMKHAQATRVEILSSVQNGTLVMELADNGRGFDPKVATQGHGLNSMAYRAGELRGALQIRSSAGHGARIILEVPLD
jgi:ligand-binding sensor domain-containing protein